MLPTLLHHLIWADLRTASALDSIAEPPAELLRTWGHLLAAEATWLARLAGREPEVPIWPTLDREACRALMVRNHDELRRWAAAPSADLDATVAYANSRGTRFENRVSDILHHVAMHGMYHRGQVAQEVRRLGGEPGSTDLIFYLRES